MRVMWGELGTGIDMQPSVRQWGLVIGLVFVGWIKAYRPNTRAWRIHRCSLHVKPRADWP